MRAFGSSQGGTRREDLRFLTGTGRYIADTLPEGALHAAFLRAPVAHARITALMVEDARAMPGVRGIWTGADLAGAGVNGPLWSVAARDQRGMAGAS
ncbi:MAG TPA: xanthine dehydrogenase family protein molybdopterin-binding subunit, partial [Paracoccus sp.]|nr:xanthine dehydrogenase family protein molybdopterin-binding subunit [Paracoccus sp. (in: a-proteobacteria)]